jgi:hypothetical protein
MLGFTKPRTYFCPRTRMWWTSWKGLNQYTKEFTHEYVVMQTSPPCLKVEDWGREVA